MKKFYPYDRWIAKEADGSYGVLYVQDDEDERGFDNFFQTFILKKGVLSKEVDQLL